MVILAFLVLQGIMYLLDIPFKNKIKNSTTVEESLKARKSLRIFRRFWSILLIIAFTIGIIALDISVGAEDSLGRDIGMIIAFAIMSGWSRLRGNVQANSKDEYLSKHKSKGYVLYLRAFESDFYSKDPKAYSFESVLNNSLQKTGMNVCAIGMTKELDAPYGATRVYVSDKSWQSDVKELMQYADSIFILVSDRQSCIWEITQSSEMLRKTCFIIDNKERYDNMRNELREHIIFPEYDELSQKSAEKEDLGESKKSADDELKELLNDSEPMLGLVLQSDGFEAIMIDDVDVFVKEVFRAEHCNKQEK